MTEKIYKIPGKDSFERMFAYFAYFNNPGSEFYELRVTDYYYSNEVLKFIDDFYKEKFDYPFDWTKYTDDFWELSNNKKSFEKADIESIIKFLSTIVNADRFIEGTMAFAIDNGHILGVLKKFQQYSENL
ncbi:MAG: hypothetical protein KAS97_02420 [Candidatus Aminicenantes bacterium]|nr:hypothetical protein [Candidatus Aminicenantes bacterium]